MKRGIVMAGLAAAMTLPLLIPASQASASCSDRKATGTVVGGIGGALIGNSISGGGGGAILGGLGGAVLGHEVARDSCGRYRHAYYRGGYRRYGAGYGAYPASASAQAQAAPLYYDDRGNPMVQPGPRATTGYPAASYAATAAPGCATPSRSYYNDRGEMVQTCGR